MKFSIIFCVIFLTFVDSKYEIIMDRMETVLGENDGVIRRISNRIRKYNRTTPVQNGVFELRTTLDNSFIITFGAYNMAGGQYKKIFGREVGPFCDTIYEDHCRKEIQRFFESTNISVKVGDCPIPAQYIDVHDFRMGGLGDYLPPYVPGNERWMVEVNITKDGKVIGGGRHYAIIRDNQKLFDSTFG